MDNQDDEADGKDVFKLCGNLYFVFEYIDHDLSGLIDMKYKFSELEVKIIIRQLFEALHYLHERKIVHRDIKTSNILITHRHQVKLADFGLTRCIESFDGRDQKSNLTNNVITMWYRPPELLLGSIKYSTTVDIWSAGCVLAELQLGRPLFPGKTEAEELDLICRVIGTPTTVTWPRVDELPNYDTMLKNMTPYGNTLRFTYGSKLNEVALQLLDRILIADPLRRPSSNIILANRYFTTTPIPPEDPTEIDGLDLAPGSSYHEYKTKLLRKQKEEESKIEAANSMVKVEQGMGEPSSKGNISQTHESSKGKHGIVNDLVPDGKRRK
jgi:cyclin-dependent kinase 12/13